VFKKELSSVVAWWWFSPRADFCTARVAQCQIIITLKIQDDCFRKIDSS
jgi:hypothetical protein